MASGDEETEMTEPTGTGLDELAVPELSDAVWMRMLANALDPETPPVDPALVPVDQPVDAAGAGFPDDDDAGTPADDADDAAAGDLPDHDPGHHNGDQDGGADLLPAHDLSGDHGVDPTALPDAEHHAWSDPHDDHGY